MALQENQRELAVRLLSNVASCQYSRGEYRKAARTYQAALQEAKSNGFPAQEGLIAMNTISLLTSLGEYDAAYRMFLDYDPEGGNLTADTRLESFLVQINLHTRRRDRAELEKSMARALREAARPVPQELIKSRSKLHHKLPEALRELRRAQVYTVISQSCTWLKDYAAAQSFALEAFRLRATFGEKSRLRDALQLAMLARLQQDFTAARRFLAIADLAGAASRIPMHAFLIDREHAQLALARRDFPAAVPHLRRAIERARSWRAEVMPADASFVQFESYLNTEVQQSFLGAIAAGDISLNQPGLAEESFLLAEEARFASIRATQFPADEFERALPAAYWQLLDEFHRAQSQQLGGKSIDPTKLATMEGRLNALEQQAGFNFQPTRSAAGSFAAWRKTLAPDDAVFSFYLAEPQSLAWIVTRNTIEVRRLPGQSALQTHLQEFSAHPATQSTTARYLSQTLLGDKLPPHLNYTFVASDEFASLPFAALPLANGAPLIAQHTIRYALSALFLSPPKSTPWSAAAIAFADPIYNTADTRSAQLRNANWMPALQLNRLSGSATETSQAFAPLRTRGFDTTVLQGASATSSRLRDALRSSPDILHLSTHIVPDRRNPAQTALALAPNQPGDSPSLFSQLDFNGLRTHTKLLVLSGCDSSAGSNITGIGVHGLARASLISGVEAVVATLWPTKDSAGPIFPHFYKAVSSRPWSSKSAAAALRSAQLQMIQRSDWAADPTYWAAYMVISRE
jgi:tetratricopeptide (TPR) repeat protein